MQTNVIQSAPGLNTTQQIPLINSTPIVTRSTQITSSQLNPIASLTTSTPVLTDPQVSVSYAPIVSAIKPPQIAGQIPVVKVVPIYD